MRSSTPDLTQSLLIKWNLKLIPYVPSKHGSQNLVLHPLWHRSHYFTKFSLPSFSSPPHLPKNIFLFLLWIHSAWKGCLGHCVCFIAVDQESVILIITFLDFLLCFSGGSDSKESVCNMGTPGSTLGLGRSPGEGNGNPLQFSCLENYTDKGAWWATVHWVSQSDTTEWLTYTAMYQSGCLSVVLPIKCCRTFAVLPSDRWEVIPT